MSATTTALDGGDRKEALSGASSGERAPSSDGGHGSLDEQQQQQQQEKHAFSDPVVAAHWRGVYDKAGYENRHRFDPGYRWTAEEERRLVRKIDLRIMVWGWVMFCALDLHRRNINRAISDNMLPELGMNTNDFNYGQTIFLVTFLAAELPSGLISKKLGADVWIPFLMVSWSVVAGSQAFLSNRAGFYAIKALLGLLMGGFIPDVVLWFTYFYTSKELPIRLSWFWTALSAVNILGALVAAGVLQMRGIAGWSGWRWLFLLEAIVSFIIGVLSWGLMPPGPCQTRNWFRGKNGWFTEHEEYIMVNRLLRDDPSKGDMNNRQAVSPKNLWLAIKDWEHWPLYLIGLTTYIPPTTPKNYLSFILSELGFGTFYANLLVMPSEFLFACQLLLLTRLSERLRERAAVSSLSNIWLLPWLAALVGLPARAAGPWVRYALLTGLLSYPYCHAVLVGWNARNSNSVRTRAVGAALYNMFVQSGNVVASNVYRDDDRPYYRRGNKVLLALACFNILLFYLVKAFYVWRNKVRARRWDALTREEQDDYRVNTADEGMKRLDFRFAH